MEEIQIFKNCASPEVMDSYDINKIIDIIKNNKNKNTHLHIIEEARGYDRNSNKYKKIKTYELPSFRFNFIFNGYAKNQYIIKSTNLIYIDVDINIDEIPFHKLIYAKWKSLSDKGYSLLIKTNGVNLQNFNECYLDIANTIGVVVDECANKATQQTVLSYDPDLYFNPKSITYSAPVTIFNNDKKVSYTHINEKEKRGISVYDTFSDNTSKLRFNNIDDYFINSDEDYLYFKEKIYICDPYLPNKIPRGKRNSTMFFLLSQIKVLNPQLSHKSLKGLSQGINRKMYPKLDDNEIDGIIKSILKGYKNNTLKMFCNKERRFLFNPKIKFTFKDKMTIVNKVNGDTKIEETKKDIYNIIESWDFIKYNKITQQKVAELSEVSTRTVKRYWLDFKEYVKDLNNDFKNNK